MPVLADRRRVIIGTDPRKASATIEMIDDGGVCLATGRFGLGQPRYLALLGHGRGQWPHRSWAVEGANGIGRPLSARLLADVASDRPRDLAGKTHREIAAELVGKLASQPVSHTYPRGNVRRAM